jgi:hypothetical protein
MSKLSDILVNAGIVQQRLLEAYNRWAPSLDEEPSDNKIAYNSPEDVVIAIEQVLQEQQLTLVRETDLDALRLYLDTVRSAVLHLVSGDQETDITVQIGTRPRDYLLPWQSESITDDLTNGETYLLVDGSKVY